MKGRTDSALWRGRHRGWATSLQGLVIHRRPGLKSNATPPSVQLYPPRIGTGTHAGKVAITWRASDLHLAPRSVSLFWRSDQPGAAWQVIPDGQQQENMDQFIWAVPPSFPTKFHIRVEAVNSLGHRGSAETTESAPVIVNRSRPRSRIIGLDPNARAGDGPSARPLR